MLKIILQPLATKITAGRARIMKVERLAEIPGNGCKQADLGQAFYHSLIKR